MSSTVHKVLGPRCPEFNCAEMNGSSLLGGCSLIDGPEEYLVGPNAKLTDDESEVNNGHGRRCKVADETDVSSWSDSSLQESTLPHVAASSSPRSHFERNHFSSSPGVALRIEPEANLSLSPLPRHITRVVRESSQLDDSNLSITTTLVKVADTLTRTGWIDSLSVESDPSTGNIHADATFSGLPELVCHAPRTEQEQQAHGQLLLQLGDEWRQATAEDGAIYYFNRRTRESRWNLPEGIVQLKVIGQGEEESSICDDEQRLCSLSELGTGGVHWATTSLLEYRQSRRKSCDASAITEVECMDGAGMEFVDHSTTKKPTYDELLSNPLLLSNEERPPLVHNIKDVCKPPPGNVLRTAQYPVCKLNLEPALQKSIVGSGHGEENTMSTAYVASHSSGDDSDTWPETTSEIGQDIQMSGLDDSNAIVDDCAESPYPQTYERAENGRFIVNNSLTLSPNINSYGKFVEPVIDFHSIPYRTRETTLDSEPHAATKCKNMGVKIDDQEEELLTALFCPYCGACLDPHLLASHVSVCHYSSNACMQKLVELALLPREIAVINRGELLRQNGCEKDGTDLPGKWTEQFSDLCIDPEQASLNYFEHYSPYQCMRHHQFYFQHHNTCFDFDNHKQLSNVERCPECGRTFARGRMRIHAKVCHRVFGEKRPIFNGRSKRCRGTAMEFTYTTTTSANVVGSLSKSSSSSTSVTTNPTPLVSVNAPTQGLQQHLHRFGYVLDKPSCCSTSSSGKKKEWSYDLISRHERKQHLYHEIQISHQSSSSQDHNSAVVNEGVSRNGLSTLCPFCNSSFQRKNLSRHFLKCKKLKEIRRARCSYVTQKIQCKVQPNTSSAPDLYCGRRRFS